MSLNKNEIIDNVKRAMRMGEYLLAYDQADNGLSEYENDKDLQYYSVLSLARIGATDQARARYELFKLGDSDNLDNAALGARLVKDSALMSASKTKSALFLEAAQLYEAVYLKKNSEYYPAINAATTYYLGGESEKSVALAQDVLKLCAETQESYWRFASQAEAHLLIGDNQLAITALTQANQYANGDLASVAATQKQLSLICNDNDVLSTLNLPRVIHFSGHIISAPGKPGRFPAELESPVAEQIAILFDELDVGIGYGSLASGADILFAETILRRGGEIHITLPFNLEEFKQISVANSGEDWLDRFDACWAQAASQSFSSEGGYHDDNALFHYCSLYAMGRACLRHQHLAAPISQVIIWDGEETDAPAGTYSDRETWMDLGYESYIIPVVGNNSAALTPPTKEPDLKEHVNRKLHAILFGDVKGFSSLPDSKLPGFVKQVMGQVAQVLDELNEKEQGGAVLMANTWGDGLFVMLRDAEIAAQCSILIQKVLKQMDFDANQAELRLAAHFGPVYELFDPVTKRNNFFGEHINRAARIEPVTPPGEVYVTEPFAAQLALNKDSHYKTDYVGYMPMAKGYGDLRMYLLRESNHHD